VVKFKKEQVFMNNITTKELEIKSELKKKIKSREDKIEELENELNDAIETIDELEGKVSEL
jgi:predicted RNase H-like nuclease (RuvC/YqgF family)